MFARKLLGRGDNRRYAKRPSPKVPRELLRIPTGGEQDILRDSVATVRADVHSMLTRFDTNHFGSLTDRRTQISGKVCETGDHLCRLHDVRVIHNQRARKQVAYVASCFRSELLRRNHVVAGPVEVVARNNRARKLLVVGLPGSQQYHAFSQIAFRAGFVDQPQQVALRSKTIAVPVLAWTTMYFLVRVAKPGTGSGRR